VEGTPTFYFPPFVKPQVRSDAGRFAVGVLLDGGESLSDALGVGRAVLGVVELECLFPGVAGLAVVVLREVGLGDVVEDVGFDETVALGAADGEGLVVVVEGLVVFVAVVGDVSQTVEGVGFTELVTVGGVLAEQGEGGLAVGARRGVVAEPRL
jgi:hypothetical protein